MSSLSLKLSAPGKVILFGEYSVVFNKPAICASLCLHTKLHILETSSDVVQLSFSALKLDKSFSLKDIKEYFQLPETDYWDAYLKLLTKAFESLYKKSYGVSDLTDAQKSSLIAFFHCFWKCFNYCSNGFSLKIDSDLTVGSGIGSSASFSVVLSAAALFYESYSKSKESVSRLTESDESGSIWLTEGFKNQISERAFSCEKIFHGSPSGVDHNTILQGSILQFIKSDPTNKITYLNSSPIRVLLVNTNIPRSTKKLVESVKRLKENHPEVVENVLKAMENIAINAVKVLTDLKKNINEVNNLEEHFGELITLNHNLLRVIGVSHPALDKIASIAQKYNFSAKLTGAGGGGFGFIYLPSKAENSVVRTIEKELTLAGFTVSEVTLGGPGLAVQELIY